MTRTTTAVLAAAALAFAAGSALAGDTPRRGVLHNPFADAPSGVLLPPIDPTGVTLHTQELGEGVYALQSSRPPADNAGFIVGDRGVLVIDAHINPAMAGQIIDAVRAVTDKPILYLVHTNYHGDHVFGNTAFPETTQIIAHRATAEHIAHPGYLDLERRLMVAASGSSPDAFDNVDVRLPDVTFEDTLTIDLGNKLVEVRHFGHGNTAGDTVVYEPDTGALWTGNLIISGAVPPMFEIGAAEYLDTLTALNTALDVRTIVPGHGVVSEGPAHLASNIAYLGHLLASVRERVGNGQTLAQVLDGFPLDSAFEPDPASPLSGITPVLRGFHRLNVKRTYDAVAGAPELTAQAD
ncbi:MAG: hypothetical protein DHS20C14_14260 [Phycisphaeraceae bacterium]|nr:MAG: hypothetical protein DHS20C14_14260 [Phycisphaeraceae bacterium]